MLARDSAGRRCSLIAVFSQYFHAARLFLLAMAGFVTVVFVTFLGFVIDLSAGIAGTSALVVMWLCWSWWRAAVGDEGTSASLMGLAGGRGARVFGEQQPRVRAIAAAFVVTPAAVILALISRLDEWGAGVDELAAAYATVVVVVAFVAPALVTRLGRR